MTFDTGRAPVLITTGYKHLRTHFIKYATGNLRIILRCNFWSLLNVLSRITRERACARLSFSFYAARERNTRRGYMYIVSRLKFQTTRQKRVQSREPFPRDSCYAVYGVSSFFFPRSLPPFLVRNCGRGRLMWQNGKLQRARPESPRRIIL